MKRNEAVASLCHAFKNERLAQAYVVEGDLKGDALEVVRQLLAILFCDTAPGCGDCDACRRVAADSHPDVMWVRPESKSRRISIEQVRNLQARVSQTSYGGGWKAVVIVGADRLGVEAANAFLKILEEPPPRTCLVLLTDAPQFLLPTIVSRCQRLSVSGGTPAFPDEWRDEIDRILSDAARDRGRGLVMETLRPSARLVRLLGDIKTAVTALEEDSAGGEGSKAEADELAARISARVLELRSEAMRRLLSWYRDVLVLVCGSEDDVLYCPEHRETLAEIAGRLSYREALENCRCVETMQRRLERNLPEALVLHEGFSLLKT